MGLAVGWCEEWTRSQLWTWLGDMSIRGERGVGPSWWLRARPGISYVSDSPFCSPTIGRGRLERSRESPPLRRELLADVQRVLGDDVCPRVVGLVETEAAELVGRLQLRCVARGDRDVWFLEVVLVQDAVAGLTHRDHPCGSWRESVPYLPAVSAHPARKSIHLVFDRARLATAAFTFHALAHQSTHPWFGHYHYYTLLNSARISQTQSANRDTAERMKALGALL